MIKFDCVLQLIYYSTFPLKRFCVTKIFLSFFGLEFIIEPEKPELYGTLSDHWFIKWCPVDLSLSATSLIAYWFNFWNYCRKNERSVSQLFFGKLNLI